MIVSQNIDQLWKMLKIWNIIQDLIIDAKIN